MIDLILSFLGKKRRNHRMMSKPIPKDLPTNLKIGLAGENAATALYISFTPVGHNTILGCQWRYIIPTLFPFLYAVGSPRVRHTIDKRVINGIVFGALSLCIFATFYDVYISKIIPLI
jgi:uncharacterized membrane protein